MKQNIPNSLTLLRMVLLPPFLLLLLSTSPSANSWTLALFVLLALSDALDGIVARALHQTSSFGALFDPIADKLLMMVALVGLLAKGLISAWPVALILSREFLVMGLRMGQAGKDGKIIAAEWLGKVKAVLQMVAIAAILMNWSIGPTLMWGAVILTWWSGIDYLLRYGG